MHFFEIETQPLVDINIVPRERREGPDPPHHPDFLPEVPAPFNPNRTPSEEAKAVKFWNEMNRERIAQDAYRKEMDSKLDDDLFGPVVDSAASSSRFDIPPDGFPSGSSGSE